jgi:hypothetical protein
MGYHIAVQNTQISTDSEFAQSLERVFRELKPRRMEVIRARR